jgi:hypothetical protein
MRISLLIVFLALALQVSGQTGMPTRLALVTESNEAFPAADMLTAQLSRDTNLPLLERDQIEKIYREQGLSTANTDYLNFGHVLGADGLWFMIATQNGSNGSLGKAAALKSQMGVKDLTKAQNELGKPVKESMQIAVALHDRGGNL